jgi:hypothetical protein
MFPARAVQEFMDHRRAPGAYTLISRLSPADADHSAALGPDAPHGGRVAVAERSVERRVRVQDRLLRASLRHQVLCIA